MGHRMEGLHRDRAKTGADDRTAAERPMRHLQCARMASDPGPAISVLQLRIALRGLSPPVWRRVLVPEHLTLGQLHHVIQVVMGWADEHLHTFSIRGRRYGDAHEGVLQFCTVANELPLTAFH